MKKLIAFENISLDGFFCDEHNDMSWAHNDDAEWIEWTSQNAGRGGVLVFGRVTYDQMVSFWPTEDAKRMMPAVAKGMNDAKKVVFSKKMKKATWHNTAVVNADIAGAVKKLKADADADLVVMGSGSIVSQLTAAGLVDVFQLVVHPIILGTGRTLFEGVRDHVSLHLEDERRFKNGNVVLTYCAKR
jgi:dihydrofolate reductase